ncbi:MAG: urea transporter [Gemmatimonadaceae bacterium]|nr:urea transporter [Gemmatimonadaceae bacterium]
MRWNSSGLAIDDADGRLHPVAFLDAVLRGVGQVMLQNNSFTGLIFLAGISWHSVLYGLATLIGAAVGTATAVLLDADRSDVRAGLFGFNGALVGVALVVFLEPNVLTWICVVLGAACSTVAMAALLQLFAASRLPALTAPFVVTTLCFVLAASRFAAVLATDARPIAGLPGAATVEGVVSTSTVAHGLASGVAQVFLQDNVITGALFALGLLVSSSVACLAALAGSLAGLLLGWALGAGEPALRSGALGFNGVLTAIALSAAYAPSVTSLAYVATAVALATVLSATLSAALQPMGVPALTAPFVLVVWVFVAAAPRFSRLL